MNVDRLQQPNPTLVQGFRPHSPTQNELSGLVPLRVARKAEELELAFLPDSPEGRAIVARLKAAGGQLRARPRTFIDAEPASATPPGVVTTNWPDERGVRS